MSETQAVNAQGDTDVHERQTSPKSLVRPDLLGFSFHLAWLCLFMYNVVPDFAGSKQDDFNALSPVYFYSMVSLVVVLLLGIWKTRPFMQFARSKAGCVSAPLVCSAGTLLYTLYAMGVIEGAVVPALLIAGGIMTGASSAVMAAHWASVFGKAKARAVIMNFTLILVAVLIACLAISYLFPAMALVVATLLPLASGASLIYADRYTKDGDGSKDPCPRTRRSRKTYLILICAVALLGLSTGCLSLIGDNGLHLEQLFYSMTSIIVLVTVGWLVLRESKESFPTLFVTPLVVLFVFALPYIRFSDYDAATVFYAMGSASLELMLLFEAVLFALLFDFSCARTFMIARVTMAVSGMAGWLLTTAIVDSWGDGAAMQAVGTAILMASEVVIAALVVTYQLLRKKGHTSPGLNTRAADVYTPDSADGTPTDGTPAPETQPAAPVSQADVVEAAVERYGLSPREADVLRLLVAGDSTAQIQDKLCIAAGTFNYHMRNIYSKLDVHSRQELLVRLYSGAKQ